MANVLVDESSLSNIADAIREVHSTTRTYLPSEMADALKPSGTVSLTNNGSYSVKKYETATVAVPAPTLVTKSVTTNGIYQASDDSADGYSSVTVAVDGSADLGTKTITENGTYQASSDSLDGYSSVTVAVDRAWTTEGIADGSEPAGDFTVASVTLSPYAFACRSEIGKVTFTGATSVPTGLFTDATFDELYFPEVTGNNDSGNAFLRCTGNKIVFDKLTGVSQWKYWFRYSNVVTVDFPSTFTIIRKGMFYTSGSMTNLILRRTSAIVTLESDNLISTSSTYASNLTVYVPQALIASYQTATNWATAYGYNANLFQALEGSAFE